MERKRNAKLGIEDFGVRIIRKLDHGVDELVGAGDGDRLRRIDPSDPQSRIRLDLQKDPADHRLGLLHSNTESDHGAVPLPHRSLLLRG